MWNFMVYNIALLLITNIVTSNESIRCPEKCSCLVPSRLTCKLANLTELPIINETTSVKMTADFSHNYINVVNGYNFQTSNIVHLQLNNNNISFINIDAFKQLVRLRSLYLNENNINNIQETLFDDNKQLVTLDLSSNPLKFIDEHVFRYNVRMLTLNTGNCQLTSFRFLVDLTNGALAIKMMENKKSRTHYTDVVFNGSFNRGVVTLDGETIIAISVLREFSLEGNDVMDCPCQLLQYTVVSCQTNYATINRWRQYARTCYIENPFTHPIDNKLYDIILRTLQTKISSSSTTTTLTPPLRLLSIATTTSLDTKEKQKDEIEDYLLPQSDGNLFDKAVALNETKKKSDERYYDSEFERKIASKKDIQTNKFNSQSNEIPIFYRIPIILCSIFACLFILALLGCLFIRRKKRNNKKNNTNKKSAISLPIIYTRNDIYERLPQRPQSHVYEEINNKLLNVTFSDLETSSSLDNDGTSKNNEETIIIDRKKKVTFFDLETPSSLDGATSKNAETIIIIDKKKKVTFSDLETPSLDNNNSATTSKEETIIIIDKKNSHYDKLPSRSRPKRYSLAWPVDVKTIIHEESNYYEDIDNSKMEGPLLPKEDDYLPMNKSSPPTTSPADDDDDDNNDNNNYTIIIGSSNNY